MDPERDDLELEPGQDQEPDTSEVEAEQAPADTSTQDTPKKWAGKYDKPEDLEKAYEEAQRKISELGDKNTRYETFLSTPAPAPYPGYPMGVAPGAPIAPATPAEPDLGISDEEWYSNPKAAAAKLVAAAEERATKRATERVMQITNLNQTEQQFYATYPELKKHPRLVNAAAAEVTQKLSQLDPYRRQVLYPDPMKAVADTVKADLAAIAEEARTKPTKQNPPLHVGPGGGAAPAPAARQEPSKPKTEEELFREGFAEVSKMHHR